MKKIITGLALSSLLLISLVQAEELEVKVELQPIIMLAGGSGVLTRCIEFELFDRAAPGSPIVISENIEFDVDVEAGTAIGEATVTVPDGDYYCITARDPLHTLRRTDESFYYDSVRGVYVADFTEDPATGGDWLIGGDLNGDNVIDDIDHDIYDDRWNRSYGSGDTPCGYQNPDPDDLYHADIGGDGFVDTGDFTFLLINHLQTSEPACTPDHTPISIRVNFQPPDSLVPPGYYVDSGGIYETHDGPSGNRDYGWL